MQVFLGFFGITRSLRHTASGIRRNIVEPLRRAGLGARAFAHFHQPAVIDNPRSGEAMLPCDPAAHELLRCDSCLTEPQDEALVEPELAFCRSFADPFADGYASVRNLCFQLRSLERLWSLLGPLVEPADWVLFLRPDLAYLDPLDARAAIAVLEARSCAWGVPSWHDWGGLNDRFALCRGDAAASYATRRRYLYEATAALGGLHGESLLAYAARASGVAAGSLAMRAIRVRADGKGAPQDVALFCPEAARNQAA